MGKIIDKFRLGMIKNFQNDRDYFFIIILAICLFIRLPYFFIGMISPDEHGFFILGDLINQGELPHENYFDNKPALVWYIYSIPSLLFKSVAFSRFFGFIIIYSSCYFFYKLILNHYNSSTAKISSIFFIITSSFVGTETADQPIGPGLNIIVEHFCNFFLIMSIYFFLNKKRFYNYFCYIFLFLLIYLRINYLVILPILIIYLNIKNKNLEILKLVFVGILLFMIIHHSYFISYSRILDLKNFYFVLISYGTESSELFYALKKYYNFLTLPLYSFNLINLRFYISLFIWIPSFLSIIFLFFSKEIKNEINIIFLILFFLILYSLTYGGAYEYYLIALTPFISFFAAQIFSKFKKLNISIIFILLLNVLISTYSQHLWLISRLKNNEEIYLGPDHKIAKFIYDNNLDVKKAFYFNYPIIYFHTNTKPLIKLIEPIKINYFFNKLSKEKDINKVYQEIFDLNPSIVLYDRNQWNIINSLAHNLIIDNLKNYKKIYESGFLELYQKN